MHVQIGAGRHVHSSPAASTSSHPHDLIESFDAHRARVHPQTAADGARDAFHPLETTNPRSRRRAAEALEADRHARRDLALLPIHLELREIAPRRMDNQPGDAAVAHQQIGAAAHDENGQVLRAREARISRAKPASVAGSAQKRAGPPTRSVVCLESGSYSSTVPSAPSNACKFLQEGEIRAELGAGFVDIARAQAQEEIARFQQGRHAGRQTGKVRLVTGVRMAAPLQGVDDGLPADSGDRRLAGGIDIGDHHHVGCSNASPNCVRKACVRV